ncbi:hypothetical protein HKX48_007433, partial [Thoreauomyces humboldtii]
LQLGRRPRPSLQPKARFLGVLVLGLIPSLLHRFLRFLRSHDKEGRRDLQGQAKEVGTAQGLHPPRGPLRREQAKDL